MFVFVFVDLGKLIAKRVGEGRGMVLWGWDEGALDKGVAERLNGRLLLPT